MDRLKVTPLVTVFACTSFPLLLIPDGDAATGGKEAEKQADRQTERQTQMKPSVTSPLLYSRRF